MTSIETSKQLMSSLVQFKKLHIKNKPQHGLHPSEIHMLFMINQLTMNRQEGIKVTEISKALYVSPPTVTQKINSLEKKGLIIRSHSKSDRRKVLISTSGKANELIESMQNVFLQKCIGLVDYLGNDQSQKLNMLLNKTFKYFNNYSNTQENS